MKTPSYILIRADGSILHTLYLRILYERETRQLPESFIKKSGNQPPSKDALLSPQERLDGLVP